jgi:hypothetical protein
MKYKAEDIEIYEPFPLESLFPPGMFSEEDSPASKQAVEVIRVIEKLILTGSRQSTLLSRYALLQTLPRIIQKRKEAGSYKEIDIMEGFLRQFCYSLSPEWHWEFLAELNEDEIEVFFKNYLLSHELWGKTEGAALLVRTILESVVHCEIRVNVNPMEIEDREIPEDKISMLGNRFSTMGEDFSLGKRYFSRPGTYHIYVGPISFQILGKFQEAGWADDTNPSPKLNKLVEFAEPYFLKSDIHFILATKGFNLGKARIGEDRLGEVLFN